MSGWTDRFARAACLALAFASSIGVARAQSAFPARSVRFIVPFAPGGPPDIAARLFGQKLQEKWGQPVIVENRPGAAGNIGVAVVARAEPDGYTILVTSSALAVNLTLFEHPGYALRDFEVVAVPVVSPNIVVAAPASRHATLASVVADARTENFSYSSPGVGTTSHLTGELVFRIINKLDIRHVPFNGGPPAVAAVLGEQVQLGVVALPSALGQVKAGGLKALATTMAVRLPELPDTPTLRESGVGDVQSATSIGFFLPANAPAAIVDKVNADINAIVASGAIDRELASAGFKPMTPDRREARAYVEREMNEWGAVIRTAGIKAE